VPGPGDEGDIRIAQNLAAPIKTVRLQVKALKASGLSSEQILPEYEPKLIAAYPDREHPQLIDSHTNYDAL